VTSAPGTPTGKVVFKSNGMVLGTVPLAQGQAVLQTTFAQAGKYTIKAVYQGSRNYGRSTGSVVQVVH
jgi:Bacterial Ig-like domain (group 3)